MGARPITEFFSFNLDHKWGQDHNYYSLSLTMVEETGDITEERIQHKKTSRLTGEGTTGTRSTTVWSEEPT
jgi:hypothetical protein